MREMKATIGAAWLARLALATLLIGFARAAEEGKVFDYIDTDAWPGTCATGEVQSPVLISTDGIPKITSERMTADVEDFGAIDKLKIFHTGMAIEIKWEEWTRQPKLGLPAVDGDPRAVFESGAFTSAQFEQLPVEPFQFHFHVPGENALDGKWSGGEVHIVSKVADGESDYCDDIETGCLVVYGILLEHARGIEEVNEVLEPFLNSLPPLRIGEEYGVELDFEFDLNDLLPENKSYITFPGSLTTPPCTEGLVWLLMRTPQQVSVEQIKALQQTVALTPGADCLQPKDTPKDLRLSNKEVEEMLESIEVCPVPRQTRNNRPPQPLNGRNFKTAIV